MTHLFIVSHVDDAEISCGGTIAKLKSKGEYVNVISLSHTYDGYDLSNEFVDSMDFLQAERYAYNVATRRFNSNENYICDIVYEKVRGYDFVYTHDTADRHDDHRIVAEKVRRVYSGSLFTFIAPHNGQIEETYFVELSEEQLNKKIEALACYKSQANRPYMDPEFIRSWARYNGIKCGKKYAEAFKIHRIMG